MKAMIDNQVIDKVEYTPQYRGNMNRFKITLKEEDGQVAIVYLFSRRDTSKTKRLMSFLKEGNALSAELTIILDPESGGDRNIAMVTKIISSIPPTQLQLTA